MVVAAAAGPPNAHRRIVAFPQQKIAFGVFSGISVVPALVIFRLPRLHSTPDYGF